jgi:hypothetical protein
MTRCRCDCPLKTPGLDKYGASVVFRDVAETKRRPVWARRTPDSISCFRHRPGNSRNAGHSDQGGSWHFRFRDGRTTWNFLRSVFYPHGFGFWLTDRSILAQTNYQYRDESQAPQCAGRYKPGDASSNNRDTDIFHCAHIIKRRYESSSSSRVIITMSARFQIHDV